MDENHPWNAAVSMVNGENPPPGYFSISEYRRVHNSGECLDDLPPQIIICRTSFKLYYPKTGGRSKAMWTVYDSKRTFDISITAGLSLTLNEFQDTVAASWVNEFLDAPSEPRQSSFPAHTNEKPYRWR